MKELTFDKLLDQLTLEQHYPYWREIKAELLLRVAKLEKENKELKMQAEEIKETNFNNVLISGQQIADLQQQVARGNDAIELVGKIKEIFKDSNTFLVGDAQWRVEKLEVLLREYEAKEVPCKK